MTCKICGFGNYKILKLQGNVNFIKCMNCSVEFIYPLPSNNYSYYDDFNDTQRVRKNIQKYTDGAKEALSHQFEMITLLGGNLGEKKLLDVGFGGGHILLGAKEIGFDVYGVEVDKVACREVKKAIDSVYNCYLEDAPFKEGFFDVIKMAQVLEHASNPISVLKSANKFLKNTGTLIIDVPNQGSLLAKIRKLFNRIGLLKTGFGFLHYPNHLYGFNKKSLSKALEISGFKVRKIVFTSTMDKKYHPTTPAYNESLEKKLLKIFYKAFGHESTICIYAEKI